MGNEKHYDKLVRDRIPEIIEKNGGYASIRVAEGTEILDYLKKKLLEEADEFAQSGDRMELADILEVIYAICDHHNISRDELETIRQKKADERGAFLKLIILEKTK